MITESTTKRKANGQFVRTHALWRPERWDDGFVDPYGYFRVYRPDYPKCWGSGYAKRYVVVYWLATGHVLGDDEDIHHEDGDCTNDAMGNLSLINHGDHARLHNPKTILECQFCGRSFPLPRGKATKGIRFCSQQCFHSAPRSDEHKRNITRGQLRSYACDNRPSIRKLNDEDAATVRTLAKYCTQREIASLFSISQTTVRNVITRCGGYK